MGGNRGRCPECPPCCSCHIPCAPQEHGSPSPFWEQELESLHFVIEMKNEHIHGLDKKLLNLETVVGSKGRLQVGFPLSISSPHP